MEFKMIAFACVSKSENSAAEQWKKGIVYHTRDHTPPALLTLCAVNTFVAMGVAVTCG